jgi:hypothetical protein
MSIEVGNTGNVSGEELVESELEVWGYSIQSISHMDLIKWRKMELFLVAFRVRGTVKAALAAMPTPISRRIVELWRSNNTLQFGERFQLAHEDFADSQEELIYELNAQIKPGQTPLSILATLNANRPAKWRANVQVTHELGAKVMSALQAAQQRDQLALVDADLPQLPDPSDSA